MKNAGKACNNRLYRHIRTFEKIVKNYFVIYYKNALKTFLGMLASLLYVTGPLSFYGIWCYTEERKNILPKYVYYAFYPLHLLVLWAIVKIFM